MTDVPARPTPVERRFAELVRRHRLGSPATDQLRELLELVAEDPLAPTAVRDRAQALNDHLADSLIALDLPQVAAAGTIADLGSGAGFPGLPLAIALPTARVALIESNRRKGAFIRRAIAACGLVNTEVVSSRAESWPDGLGRFDLVTARALASLDVVAEYAAPLLRVGGALVAWRGRRHREVEDDAARAASKLGLQIHEPVAVVPYAGAEHRHLHLMSKVRETPAGFPRRPGVAAKRPLGSAKRPSDRARR